MGASAREFLPVSRHGRSRKVRVRPPDRLACRTSSLLPQESVIRSSLHRLLPTRPLPIAVLSAALLLTACSPSSLDVGDYDPKLTTVTSASTCDELADASINIMQELFDQVAGLTTAEVSTLDDNPALVALDEEASAVEAKVTTLQCRPSEQDRRVTERADRLEVDGEVAEFLRDTFLDRLS
jgi:hypothetical protein